MAWCGVCLVLVLSWICAFSCFLSCFFFLMIRRPPRSTQSRSSAASDVYKRQAWPSDGARFRRRWCSSLLGARSDARAQPPFWRQAVSYTHLRAHETVLDLVCRLLLEKKKQKNTKIHTKQSTITTPAPITEVTQEVTRNTTS